MTKPPTRPAAPVPAIGAAPFTRATWPKLDAPRGTHRVSLDRVYAVELEQLRREATDQGYADGFAKGMAAAGLAVDQATEQARAEVTADHAARVQRCESALSALGQAASLLHDRSRPALDDLADLVVATALDLAEAVVGRELAVVASPGADALARALRVLPEEAVVTIRLHPDDLATLDPAEAPAGVTLVADPSVQRGGALADSGAQHVDAQLGPALARVREALGC